MKGGGMKEMLSREVELGLKIGALCVALLFLAACSGKKEVKAVSQESKIAQEAFSVAEELRSAYVEKKFAAIADVSTQDSYKEISDSIKFFDSVELEFVPRWVEIEKGKVFLNVAWKGAWVVGKDTVRERGMAVFQLEGTPLKLSSILRGSPFKYPQ